MLAFDRRAASVVWTAMLLLATFYVVFAVRKTLFVFVLALFLAYMLYPLVLRLLGLTRRKLKPVAATGIVFAILVIAIGVVLAIVGPLLAEQADRFADQVPGLLKNASFLDKIPLPEWLVPDRAKLTQFAREHLGDGTQYAAPLAKSVGQFLLVLTANSIFVVLIPILAFLMIANGHAMREQFLAWSKNKSHATMWRHIVDDLDTLLGGYIRALVILALATIVCYSLVFTIAGVPFGLLLALFAGVLEFIPVLGPLIAAVACVVVAGIGGYEHVLWILGFIALYRVFQDYVLNPYLMSNVAAVPPLLVLFGLLAGEELGGIAGVFLATPVLAAGLILARRIEAEMRTTTTAATKAAKAEG